eukprot:TRINITY_DN5862_c0_g1_i1.p2 TRINITY_DN5862_c0_g1~~TRINITY_DN5862_c0_g1_i1.p2  ORF type:complete len:132 (-),score=7.25 TRINITY_DN5862_c0_g1_i1:274-669(-)
MCIRDSINAEYMGDYIVQKRRHSTFSYTDFDLYCREEKIDTVVVTGVWTNVCVRSTASDALYHAYNVVAVSDCCASANEEMHQGGLRDMGLFAEIKTLEEYLREWPAREGAKQANCYCGQDSYRRRGELLI